MDENGRGAYLLFRWSPSGYTLVERPGDPPEVGAEVEDGERALSRDEDRAVAAARATQRPCAYLLPAEADREPARLAYSSGSFWTLCSVAYVVVSALIFVGVRERVVDLDEGVPLVRERVLGEDRLHRALRFARPAVDALLRVDDQDPLELVDAVDRADVDAREVFDVDAGLGDDVRHSCESSLARARCSVRAAGVALRSRLVSSSTSSGARSTSADFTITWSNPAVCARCKPGAVGVVREAHDRDVRPGVRDLLRLDPRDVHDDEVGRVDAVARDQTMAREQDLELAAEEEVDPDEQDRRHAPDTSNSRRGRRYFAGWGSPKGSR